MSKKESNISRPFMEVSLIKRSVKGDDITEGWSISHVTKIKEDGYNIEVYLNLKSCLIITTSSEHMGLLNIEKKDYSDFKEHVVLFEKNKIIEMTIEPKLL